MLSEFLLTFATPVGRMTRQLGLLRQSTALSARGRRQRKGWAPHHRRCQAVVAQIVGQLGRHRTAIVLGSGLVRDVPLDLLCARFQRVVLIDAVQLPQVRLRSPGRSRAGSRRTGIAQPPFRMICQRAASPGTSRILGASLDVSA